MSEAVLQTHGSAVSALADELGLVERSVQTFVVRKPDGEVPHFRVLYSKTD